jgi:hypothetical protein
MIPAVNSLAGKTVDQIITANAGQRVLGPLITNIMQSIGWETISGPGAYAEGLTIMQVGDKVMGGTSVPVNTKIDNGGVSMKGSKFSFTQILIFVVINILCI